MMVDQKKTDEMRARLRTMLSPRRYAHSEAVARQAVILAERYGADREKAFVAGLVHDCCKELPDDALLHILRRSAIMGRDIMMQTPAIWHAFAGALMIGEAFGIEDEDILNAVRYHTTGRGGMSLLERVIFVADLTSDDRDYPDYPEMQRLSQLDLGEAMLYALRFFIRRMAKTGRLIHPLTVDAYNSELLLLGQAARSHPTEKERLI